MLCNSKSNVYKVKTTKEFRIQGGYTRYKIGVSKGKNYMFFQIPKRVL